jgi:YHS domain-containing protein
MRFLILLVVLFWAVGLLLRAVGRLLRGLLSPPAAGNRQAVEQGQNTAIARRLVRDPVCGVHVAEARAIPLRSGTELVHFCSTQCRDKYVADGSKLAANG